MEPTVSPPVPSEEDSRLVKSYVLHTLALDVLERDIRQLRQAPLKMPDLYILSLSDVQRRITQQLADVKRQMRRSGIKVYEENRSRKGLEALYVCRGYHRRLFMLPSFARSEVRRELGAFLGLDLTLTE
ncbi:hypothetical protein ACE3NQ_05640 [Paenibacillus terreus]|uniref:Uncharacterized protein n=1 Tax=Paenibacillus terreus TaxID=1387834 RepID=A0ABV5B3Z3_9BACL